MSEHAPGPWAFEARNHALADTGDYEGCYHITSADGRRVIDIWSDDDLDEANARLIAAAPDLLEAAKEAIAELYRVSPSFAAPKLRAAVAKATLFQPEDTK